MKTIEEYIEEAKQRASLSAGQEACQRAELEKAVRAAGESMGLLRGLELARVAAVGEKKDRSDLTDPTDLGGKKQQ